MFQGEVSTNLDYVFVSVFVPELITHSVVLICPVLHGNFVEGFHTNRTDLDVPAKKNISRVSLQDTLKCSLSV